MTNLNDLTKNISFKWRIQSFSKTSSSASCVAYVDARDVMRTLDEVVGPENWQSDFKEIKGNLYAGVGIKIDGEWVWKWDCGTESNTEKEKGEASDSFKRASVKWGVSRFLYDIPIQFIKTNEPKRHDNYPYPIDHYGNKIKDLTAHLNQVNKVTYMKSRQNSPEIKKIIDKIEICQSIDELRLIREDNINLEVENNLYKKALLKRYELLSTPQKESIQ